MTRKSRGGRDHVLLGDPALDEPVRIRELERAHSAVGGEVGIEDDEVVAFGSEPYELVTVGVHDVLVRDGRAARTGARLRLALERSRGRGVDTLHRLELESAEAPGREPHGDAIRQLRERPLERLVVGSSGMPAVRPASLAERRRVLHERHALALDRARDERLRAIADPAERLERVTKLADVVAVTGRDVPAEGTEPGLELAERHDLVRRLVRLELVAIDDDRKARQALVRGGLEPFVVLTLLQLAVADHDDDPPAAAEVPLRPRDPAALRDPHTERPGVGLDTGDSDVRMTVEPTETA